MENTQLQFDSSVEVYPIPFDVGFAAFFSGQECPYPEGTIQCKEWNAGFNEAWASEMEEYDIADEPFVLEEFEDFDEDLEDFI